MAKKEESCEGGTSPAQPVRRLNLITNTASPGGQIDAEMNLSIKEKLLSELNKSELYLLSVIASREKRGLPSPTISDLSSATGWDSRKTSKVLKILVDKGKVSLTLFRDAEAFSLLNRGYKNGCICCGSVKRLHNHHYPIRQSDGGKHTVLMCESCHFEFHKMTDYGIYKTIEKL